jgi:hypothetical protein
MRAVPKRLDYHLFISPPPLSLFKSNLFKMAGKLFFARIHPCITSSCIFFCLACYPSLNPAKNRRAQSRALKAIQDLDYNDIASM